MQDPKTLKRWMVFQLAARPNGTVDKTPLSVLGGFAKSDDPATWASYDQARQYCLDHKDCQLGFVLGEEVGLVVVDIDKARTSKEQEWPEWVQREVEELDSFTEESVSGLGLHVWVWGSIPANMNRQKLHVELHGSKKMFVVTNEFAQQWEKIQERDLTKLVARVEAGQIGPDYKPGIKACSYNDKKFQELMAGHWEDYFPSHSEARMSALYTLATKHAGNAEKMRAEYEESELCAQKPDKLRLLEREISLAVSWWETRHPATPAFDFPAAESATDYDFVIAPAPGQTDGWFPLGDFSLIGGSSGANKTTWALQMLTSQRRKEPVEGHETYGRPFLLLLEDRGPRALRRTLRRMRLDEKDVPYKMVRDDVPAGRPGVAVKWAVEDCKRENGEMPQVVLVEGLDMMVRKAVEMDSVTAAMKELQIVAAHYHLAIVGTVGAPKMKEDEQYTNYRERIFGSIAWGRKAETIVALSCVGTDADPERVLVFLPRNAPPERFDKKMVNGRLAPAIPTPKEDIAMSWLVQQRDGFTLAEAKLHFNRHGGATPKKINAAIEALFKDQKIEFDNLSKRWVWTNTKFGQKDGTPEGGANE